MTTSSSPPSPRALGRGLASLIAVPDPPPKPSVPLVKEAVVQVGERTLSLGRSTSTYYLVDESDRDVFGRATSTVVPFESLDVRELVNLIGELCTRVREQEGSIEALRGRIAEMAR